MVMWIQNTARGMKNSCAVSWYIVFMDKLLSKMIQCKSCIKLTLKVLYIASRDN